MTYSKGFRSPMRTTCMNGCKSYNCLEGKQREICSLFSFVLYVFERGFRISPKSTEGNGRLKPGKLINLIGHIWNFIRQFQYHYFDVQKHKFIQRWASLYAHPVENIQEDVRVHRRSHCSIVSNNFCLM